jgi:uncharacterized protein (UPF0332 family)
MLEQTRIKQAKDNVTKYLEEDILLKDRLFRQIVFDTYKRNCKESITSAEMLFNNNTSNLWVIVCSYYSMFYIANAVLYKLGYKTTSKIAHKVTSDALIVFVREKLKKNLLKDYEDAKDEALEIIGRKADEIIVNFDRELDKRSIFQYESTEEIKSSKAKTSIDRAKNFIIEMERLL